MVGELPAAQQQRCEDKSLTSFIVGVGVKPA
jgi:hypothetical protein